MYFKSVIYRIGTRNNHTLLNILLSTNRSSHISALCYGPSLVCGLSSGRSDLVKYRGVVYIPEGMTSCQGNEDSLPKLTTPVDYRVAQLKSLVSSYTGEL